MVTCHSQVWAGFVSLTRYEAGLFGCEGGNIMYIAENKEQFTDPFYQTTVELYPWESELLQSPVIRRLKFLSHYGTGSFTTSAKHSRFEHTLGVWTIISSFFQKEEELRIAALLHDIGHLPFSHAVERTLGFNHHALTESLIKDEAIGSILQKYGFDPFRIIDILNTDSPLSHKTNYLSADHLDSFLRDSYMLGKRMKHPADIIQKITFHHHYVEADIDTAKTIMEAIHFDHTHFLHPTLLALDVLLAEAIKVYASHHHVELSVIQGLTNQELIQLLASSHVQLIHELLSIIMFYPEKILVQQAAGENTRTMGVKKVYDKSPLVDGNPLPSLCHESHQLLQSIRALQRQYYFTII